MGGLTILLLPGALERFGIDLTLTLRGWVRGGGGGGRGGGNFGVGDRWAAGQIEIAGTQPETAPNTHREMGGGGEGAGNGINEHTGSPGEEAHSDDRGRAKLRCNLHFKMV